MYIDSEKPIFYRTHKVCTGWVIKKCKLKRIEYDFSDKEVREKLKNMGFLLKVDK